MSTSPTNDFLAGYEQAEKDILFMVKCFMDSADEMVDNYRSETVGAAKISWEGIHQAIKDGVHKL
jgi:hypothetical protein